MKNINTIVNDNELVKFFQEGNKDAGQEFMDRHVNDLRKIAYFTFQKVNYDFSLNEDRYSDALVVTLQAAYEALKSYDFKSSNIMTFIKSKTFWAFKTLQRQNAKYDDRFDSIGDKEPQKGNFKEPDQEYHNHNIMEAFDQLLKNLPEGSKQRTCLVLLREAMSKNEHRPKVYVANAMGITRQQVDNILKSAADFAPASLREEIRHSFHDATNITYAQKK